MEDLRRHVIDFFLASLTGLWNDFDFETFFEEFQYNLRRKLIEHGLTDNFMEYWEQWSESYEGFGDLSPFALDTNYINIDEREILLSICELHYKRCKETFEETFEHLVELNDKLNDDRHSLNLSEKIALFDECIHAQHENGFILEDYFNDPDELREEAEEEWNDLKKRQLAKGKIYNLRLSGTLI